MPSARHRAGRLLVLAAIAAGLAACATAAPPDEFRQRKMLYASGRHLEFSLKHRGANTTLVVSPEELARAQAEAWWGDPVGTAREAEPAEVEEYDPWKSYNQGMFWFNRQVDRWVLKPAATGWDTVVPARVQRSLHHAFENLGMPRRAVNHFLQLRADAGVREVGRFLVNSTLGIAGLLDVATTLGLEGRDADLGQTLGAYGIGPGPYVILPVLPPLTVRDGVGFLADAALDPLNYLLPLAATAGLRGVNLVNERARNLELLEELEREVFDAYSAARNAYLQRRKRAIEEAVRESP